MKTFGHEPHPGLPESLPEGEQILWQGRPSVRGLALDAFHVGKVSLYLGALLAVSVGLDVSRGASVGAALVGGLRALPLAVLCLGLLFGLAAAHARATLYTLTNRRVVIRHGVAFPMMVNLPFAAFCSAEFKARRDGRGDLPMKVQGGEGPSYVHLWPHVRPGHLGHPQPMLRSVPGIEAVAQLLASSVAAVNPKVEAS